MICADFLTGANMDNQNPETRLFSMTRFFTFLSDEQMESFLLRVLPKRPRTLFEPSNHVRD
jgi:hypothetical protein